MQIEEIGKFARMGKYRFITIPAEVRERWKSALGDVSTVCVDYNEQSDELIIVPVQVAVTSNSYFRKVMKRYMKKSNGYVWMITVPRDVAVRWENAGVTFLQKIYDENQLKLVVKPMKF